ncbi:MAG: glycosyltransferase family 4 protein [Synechococcales cyanobacterium CRU_2_2]|nr:glycosyltransferase family 4 protein [Synechococcales cyanobacterium CRU_2_2]
MPNLNRRKVTLISPSAGISHSGGAEAFSLEMARRLRPFFDVELLAGHSDDPGFYPAGGICRSVAREWVKHPLLSVWMNRIATHPDIVIEHVTSFFPCLGRLLTHTPDVIFPCNDYGGLAVAALVRSIKGTPVLYTEHAGSMSGNKPLMRNLRFHPDELVVFSPETARLVQQSHPQQSVSVIHNGVDLKRFSPEGNRVPLPFAEGPVVLCVASLCRTGHKRVELTLQALARLPGLNLLICGDGPDRAYYQALGEQLLGPDRFAIQTFRFEQMPDVYRSADLFTLASLDEPCALSYLEAMATGLPVVTTDDPMRRHTIGNAGLLCDVTDPVAYAAALETVSVQPNWQQLACANAARFSWDTVIQEYEQVLNRVIERSLATAPRHSTLPRGPARHI